MLVIQIVQCMKKSFKNYVAEESGVGIVEVVLILVILIALVVVFRTQVVDLVNRAISQFQGDGDSIINGTY